MRSPLLDIDYNKRVLTEILEHVKNRLSNINIHLDLGSGDCYLTNFLAEVLKPRKVLCIDIDEEALRKCIQLGFNAIKLDLNIGKIPLPDNSVDVITAFEVIEHLWNKDNMLEEAYRVLKQNGLLILSTPNLAAWASRLMLLFGKPPLHYDVSLKYVLHRPSYCHISLYTYELLLKHLNVIGFRVILTKGLLMPWYRKNKVIAWFTKCLSKVRPSLAPDILVIAEKV